VGKKLMVSSGIISRNQKSQKSQKRKKEICLEEEEEEEEEGNGLRSVGFLHCIRGRHERERSARETRESAQLQTSVSTGETERRSRS